MSDCCKIGAIVVNRDKPVTTAIVNRPQPIQVVTQILRGPQGPQGPPGLSGIGGGVLNLIAGEAIAAYSPVYGLNNQVFVASNNDLANFDKFIGIAENAGGVNDSIAIRTEGEIQNPSWNWTKNSFIWLSNGTLTENFPVISPTVFCQFVGRAISPVKIIVTISEPIIYNI